jgi:hypothetical protein
MQQAISIVVLRPWVIPYPCRYQALDPPPVGPQGANMPRTAPWEIPRPDTIWNAVADLDHDYRDDAGKMVHSYHCRRCRLELLLRQIMKQLGEPPD